MELVSIIITMACDRPIMGDGLFPFGHFVGSIFCAESSMLQLGVVFIYLLTGLVYDMRQVFSCIFYFLTNSSHFCHF